MKEHVLWLVQFMGVANNNTLKILRHYGDSEDAYNDIVKGNTDLLNPTERNRLKLASIKKSQEIIKLAEEYKYKIITIEEDLYPSQLRNIPNPPPLIFVRGDISLFNNYLSIAVVGTRAATKYSVKVTDSICRSLAQNEIIVVSGMAIGIDKTAHDAAIKYGGITGGILASGFDIDYPKNSMPFRDYIVERGGVILTEQLPGGQSEKWYFSLRNRIMSGITTGTLVIQAPIKSGCLLTANSAFEQNRDLFCVPPADIFDFRYGGVISLLRDGAIPVFGGKDILDAYSIEGVSVKSSYKDPKELDRVFQSPRKSAKVSSEKNPREEKEENSEEKISKNKERLLSLSDAETAVYSLLSDEPYHFDYLIKESGLSANDVNEVLLDLELEGLIKPVGGGNFIRID